MKNRLKNAWKALRENRGSGVALVLIAISCITLMTTSLLQLSYTAYKMKASERQTKLEFYEAETKLDELVAELQNEVSGAITRAQKEVWIHYSSSRSANTRRFRAELIDDMVSKLGGPYGSFNAIYLSGLVEDLTTSFGEGSRYTSDGSTFTLENVYITYESEETGNLTTVITDIVIDVSDLTLYDEWDIEKTVKFDNWSIE